MEITLRNSDKKALIDDDDFVLVSDIVWSLDGGKYVKTYRNTACEDGKIRRPAMHRVIIRNYDTKNFDVDHINGNGLDNRKCNLRLCSRQDNLRNLRKTWKTKYSKYMGVSFSFDNHRYKAYIVVSDKYIHLGYFDSEKEAALAYNKKAEELGFLTRNVILD